MTGENIWVETMIREAESCIRYNIFSRARYWLSGALKRAPKDVRVWLLLASCIEDRDVKIYCYRQILDLDPNNVKAKDAISNLAHAEKDRADERVSVLQDRIRVLRARARETKDNARLHFELALWLLASEPDFKGLEAKDGDFWSRTDTTQTSFARETPYFIRLETGREEGFFVKGITRQMAEAEDHLNLALALGLANRLEMAKARFLLILIMSRKAYHVPIEVVQSDPRLKALAKDIVSDTQKYLRRHPHHLEALNIQREAHKILQKQDGVGKMQQRIQQARILQRAAITESVDSTRQDGVRQRDKKQGLALEDEVQRLLETMGLRAVATKGSADGGIDIIAYSEDPIFSGKYIVQCKDWENPVGEPIIRDLYGVVMSERANKGILITTGRFTLAAEEFAEGKQLGLIDGDGLRDLLTNKSL